MSFIQKVKIIKQNYANGDYRIFSISPIAETNPQMKLSEYFTCSIKGKLSYLSVDKEYTMELKEISSNEKWGGTYEVISVPSLLALDLDTLTLEQSEEILSEITTTTQADYILKAYPDFIRKVLTEGKESIDVKKIYNVGEYRLNAYIRLLTDKYKYLHILQEFKQYEIDITDCKSLYDTYHDDVNIAKGFEESPYRTLINVLGRSFYKMDRLLMEIRPELESEGERCEFMILDVLDRNEQDGSSKLDANVLYTVAKEDYNSPQLLPLLKKVAIESDLIYYKEDTNELAKMATYNGECLIASFIKDKTENPHKTDFEWDKFKEIKDGTLTEEQSEVLHQLCQYDITFLDAGAGCVDCNTEYFNGEKWKRISEYSNNELVLQYRKDGIAELVKPLKYIKNPSDRLYHFETKYGIDQTLSLNHRMVFDYKMSRKDKHYLKYMSMNEFKDLQENGGRRELKFITTFNYNGDGINLSDEEIKLMCAIICDGSFYYNKNSEEMVHRDSYNTCRFHIKKDRKKIALRKLFEEGNFKYREKESMTKGYTDFYVSAPRREKEFTSYWYNCSNKQLQIICDNLIQWDGSVDYTKNGIKRNRFSTSIKQTADFVQFAYSACGYKTSISSKNRIGREKINKNNGKSYFDKSIEYTLNISKRNLVSLATKYDRDTTPTKIEEVIPKDGFEYCFSVPSEMLVLRRNNKIFITGNCGKSASMMAVIQMLEYYHKTYTCLTATGKASARLSEQTGRPSSTIHKATMSGNISTDYLIVDEDSFLSIELMCMIINAIANDNIKLLLLGDVEQLPSISCGRIIRDCIESGKVPLCTLTKCFRFTQGGMSMVSTNIRGGKFYLTEEECQKDHVVLGKNKDYEYIKSDGTIEQICNVYQSLLDKNIKPNDICVIIPQNVGSMGVFKVNNALQQIANPPKPNEKVITNKVYSNGKGYDTSFKVGDLVMNTKNNYHMMNEEEYEQTLNDEMLCKDDVATCSVFNGQIGKILSIDDKNVFKILFDQEILVFDKKDSYNLILAYASNPFRMQGSQCKYIIAVTLEQHQRMLNRQLLYTTLTRARKGIIEIGEISAMKYAVATKGDDNRKTWLKELLLDNSQ